MSFRLQINLIFIVLTLSIGLGTLWYFKHEQEKIIQHTIAAQADAISKLISEDLAKMVYLDDPDTSTDITRRIQSINNLYAAYFFDLQNRPLLIINPSQKRILKESTAINTQISFEGVALGTGHFIFDNKLLSQEKERLQTFTLTLLVLLFFITVIFIQFLDKRFIRRLSELSWALKKVSQQQDFNVQLPICKNDEIGMVRQHFNELVTHIKTHTEQLKFEASHDVLTGLYNRNYINRALQNSIDNQTDNAICYIDLDQFKVINETLGHTVGDQLLKQLSGFMQQFLSLDSDTLLARIGGDQFILLIQNTNDSEAKQLALMLKSKIKEFKYCHQDKQHHIGISMGLIFYTPLSPNHERLTATDLLSAADTACHRAKAEGRDQLLCYHFGDQQLCEVQNSLKLVSVIRTALEQEEFELYLQPIVSSQCHSNFDHFETLIRLHTANGQMIPPSLFIPVAENYGLSKEIDLWVIQSLLAKLETYPNFVNSLTMISVNLSAGSLMDSAFKEQLNQTLATSTFNLNKLCFEVTETGTISNFLKVRDFILHFRRLGCRFALDDFGTGMASFEYLSELPVDYLKIDGSFVKHIAQDPVMREMVVAMKQIGHITNTQVIAEFVETQDIVSLLQEIGVDYLQGYHCSKPLPIQQFLEAS